MAGNGPTAGGDDPDATTVPTPVGPAARTSSRLQPVTPAANGNTAAKKGRSRGHASGDSGAGGSGANAPPAAPAAQASGKPKAPATQSPPITWLVELNRQRADKQSKHRQKVTRLRGKLRLTLLPKCMDSEPRLRPGETLTQEERKSIKAFTRLQATGLGADLGPDPWIKEEAAVYNQIAASDES